MNKLQNLDLCVAAVQNVAGDEPRRRVIAKLLEGKLDYSSDDGKVIGHRRGLLCTRLAAEKLWPGG